MKRLSKIICCALFVATACLPLAAQTPGPVRPVGPPAPKPTPPQAAKAAVKMLPVKAVADSTAPKGWKKYQFGEPQLFGVIFPEKHEANGEHIQLAGADKPATTYVYTAETGTSVYMAMCAENLPFIGERMPEAIKQSFYDGMWMGMLEGMKSEMDKNGILFKIVSGEMKKITIGGLEGRSQDFTFGPLNGHTRMVIAGQRAYLALVMAPPDDGVAEREAFFNSFEIYAKR